MLRSVKSQLVEPNAGPDATPAPSVVKALLKPLVGDLQHSTAGHIPLRFSSGHRQWSRLLPAELRPACFGRLPACAPMLQVLVPCHAIAIGVAAPVQQVTMQVLGVPSRACQALGTIAQLPDLMSHFGQFQ